MTCIYGQNNQDNQLEKSVDSLVLPQFKSNEPGVSILIAKQGQILYKKAFGSANVEMNVPLQPDMIFRIGSITKQFTAIAILQLVEQGKISLQDSVQKYIKDFPSKASVITIENLLTHTSGIFDYSSLNDPSPYIERWDFTPKFILDKFKNLPLDFKPGTRYNYSNSGYLLLGLIIEIVSQKSYHIFIEENILKPLGLSHTFYANENTIIPKRVTGYTKDKGFYENCDYQSTSFGYACGDLLSNTDDLYKWNSALIEYKLVNKATLDKAFTPYKLSNGNFTTYGYGWFIDDLQGSKCIHHEGQTSGFIAEEKYFPTEKVYVAILTNVKSGEDTTSFSGDRFRLFENISLLSIGKQLQKEVTVNDTILNKYVGVYAATFKKNTTLTISKKDGKLYMDLSNGTGKNMVMLPQSDTKFLLPDVKRIKTTCEFIIENGAISKLICEQEKKSEWKKVN